MTDGIMCAWYRRRDPNEPSNMEPVRCSWRALVGTKFCKRHGDIDVQWINKDVKYCSTCRLPKPTTLFNGCSTCSGCRDRTTHDRAKKAATHATSCKATVGTTGEQCFYKAAQDGFCHKHYFTNYVVPDMDASGYILCITNHACNTFVSKSLGYKTCTPCRIKNRYTDCMRHDKDMEMDQSLFEKLCRNECFYCTYASDISGVDRYVNDAKHIDINCVACCLICNRSKNTHGVVDFANMCEHIAVIQRDFKGNLYQELFKEPLRAVYSEYKARATDKSLVFELTLEQFNKLTQRCACTHCGKFAERMTVDRIDSDIGYVMDNCQPACSTCNLLKLDQSDDEFYDRCLRIAQRKEQILNFSSDEYIRALTASDHELIILDGYVLTHPIYIEK